MSDVDLKRSHNRPFLYLKRRRYPLIGYARVLYLSVVIELQPRTSVANISDLRPEFGILFKSALVIFGKNCVRRSERVHVRDLCGAIQLQ
jgi:hypothetical protein